ncbi:hypothetical protein HZB01_01895 [Candidatus Woesearchaeota archaeon]|nr:hypothetical protein [Candidatus Woesearchaeota archaeon]
MTTERPKETVYTQYYRRTGGFGFPLFLILIGLFWLARNQGWIPQTISIWPVILIVFGLWLFWKQMTWRR